MTEYSREQLVEICEKAVVPVEHWLDRDTPSTQEKIGTAWALLKAGCEFKVCYAPENATETRGCWTDEYTIWIEITYPTFGTFDWGADHEVDTFYLPTLERLAERAGKDWY